MRTRKAGTRSKPVTSVDVARLVGVSQSVVSRAFSLDSSVAQATRERVFAAADQLGYRPNLLARSLITNRSNLIALVTGALTNPLHLSLIAATTEIAQLRGYRVLLFSTPPGAHLDHALREVLQHRPDGIVALAGSPSDEMTSACRRDGIPGRAARAGGRSRDDVSVSCDNAGESRASRNSCSPPATSASRSWRAACRRCRSARIASGLQRGRACGDRDIADHREWRQQLRRRL
jgi:DNA-binding LacI/PurR family transcriptional regulator